MKDPNRMDETFLTSFLEDWQTNGGSQSDAAQHTGGFVKAVGYSKSAGVDQLAEMVKVGQRASPSWKQAWVAYCEQAGTKFFDPSKQDPKFLTEFFEFLATSALGCMQSQAPRGRKRSRYEGAPSESVAEEVKQLQKMDSMAKQAWSEYCDTWAGGVKDPFKHNDEFLRGALASMRGEYAPPQRHRSEERGGSSLAEQVRQLQKSDPEAKQAWSDYCDDVAGGVKDPSKHDDESLGAALASMRGEDAPRKKHRSDARGVLSLTEQVKQLQKFDPAAKQAWSDYCDNWANGVKDPTRHDDDSLRAALDAMQGGGSGDAPRRSQNAKTEEAGAQSSVDKVKQLQKSHAGAKKLWSEHCDENCGGVKDPSRHDEASLQAFLSEVWTGDESFE